MGREATRAVSGGRPSVAEALRAHASVICLHFYRLDCKNNYIFHVNIKTWFNVFTQLKWHFVPMVVVCLVLISTSFTQIEKKN